MVVAVGEGEGVGVGEGLCVADVEAGEVGLGPRVGGGLGIAVATSAEVGLSGALAVGEVGVDGVRVGEAVLEGATVASAQAPVEVIKARRRNAEAASSRTRLLVVKCAG